MRNEFMGWLEERTDFETEVQMAVYNTGYQIEVDPFGGFDVNTKNYKAMARLGHNGREFVVQTVSSHWTTAEAAQMLAEMDQALKLANQMNALVARYAGRYETLKDS